MGKKWEKEEIEHLVRMMQKGLTHKEMGAKLEREVGSIKNMVYKIQCGEWGYKKFTNKIVPWYKQEEVVIGHLDIESSNLKANAGQILSWAIKIDGKDEIRSSLITTKEIQDYKTFDKRVCQEWIDAIKDIDVVTTYFGTRFDIPFLRTRCMYWGLRFPAFNGLYHWDLFYKVRSKLNLHRKSLDVACGFFGISGKTHLDLEIWNRARVGDPTALKYVYDHNIGDVEILELLFHKLEPHSKWIRKSI